MVAVLLVPQAIAYAYLAGMPPQYGLYAAIVPIIIYSLLGTSPHLAVGPVAISALLILAGVSKLADPFSNRYIELTIFAGLLIGFVQLLLGMIKMGKYVNLLSFPVITGFTSAASIIIIISQLKDVFGIQVPHFDFLYETVMHILNNINGIHLLTFIIAVSSFVLIFLLKKINRRIPSGLIVVSIGIAFSYFLELESKGVNIIGFVPSGLPTFEIPTLSIKDTISLLPTVFLVAFIGLIEAIGIAKAIENKNHHYEINTNQELVALGASKVGGSFFGALPTSGSFSRSALLHETKAKTTIASLVTVIFVVLALLYLTPLLFYLPKVILAVIIIYAVKNLFEYNLAKKIFKIHGFDFAVMLITFLVTLLVSIEIGVATGFIFSFFTLFKSRKGKMNEFAKIFSQKYHKDIYFSEESSDDPVTTLIVQNNLHFGKAEYFKETIKNKISENDQIKVLNIQFQTDSDIDTSTIKTIEEVQKLLKSKGIDHNVTATNQKITQRLQASNIKIN